MRNLLLTATLFAGILMSCNSQNQVMVNGNKMELEDGLYAKIKTNKGDILFRFYDDKAPLTTANFIALAEGNHPEVSEEYKGKPYFNGLTFHRVIPDFMIQGGDPSGNGSGGPGYQFANEADPSLSHEKGTVSMANAGPNTNGSQFFITVAPTKQLDGSYSIFGQVVEGQAVADSISMVARGRSDKPNEAVTMEEVSIIRKGKEAKKFDAPAVFATAGEEAKTKMEEEEKRKAMEAQERMAAQEKQVEDLKAEAEATGTGLYYQVLEEGDGPKPTQGQTVLMHYAGYLPDGTLFDTSIKEIAEKEGKYDKGREPYDPFPVQYGPGARVIEGWKQGLQLMNVGDKYKLIIPPQLGYGERGAVGLIPPNSWLVFEVEMVGIK